MGVSARRDIGAYLKGALARIPETITAAAGNDGSEVDGPSIDRQDYGHALSCKVLIPYSATLAEDETLTLAANLQDANDDGSGSPDSGDWGDYGDALASAVVATGPAGGGTVNGVAELDVDLSGAKRHLRLQSTADLSASGTDTVDVAGVVVLGGQDEIPAS